jgi:hypothetical protein
MVPPAEIVLEPNLDDAPVVSPVIVTEPPVLIVFPVAAEPKSMSTASDLVLLASTLIEPDVDVTELL